MASTSSPPSKRRDANIEKMISVSKLFRFDIRIAVANVVQSFVVHQHSGVLVHDGGMRAQDDVVRLIAEDIRRES